MQPVAAIVLTAEQLHTAMPYATPPNINRFLAPLRTTMAKHGIDTPLRMAQFLAQVAHESGSLRYTEEIASGSAYEGRKDLGNTEIGDGPAFKGRGLIQITGRANYQAFYEATGIDVVSNPALVANDPILAAETAGWFWAKHNLNVLADENNPTAITRAINGGLLGLPDRLALLATCKAALGCPA